MINKMYKRNVFSFVLLLSVIIFFNPCVYGAGGAVKEGAIKKGMKLSEFSLSVPESTEVQKYLGLKNTNPFFLSQVQAKIIIVEFYSIYCAACQKQAPLNNKLYKYIQGSSKLKNDVKMIGIGLGNKPFEIKYFREAHNVRFPLFPDADKNILNKLGIKVTPITILMEPDGTVLATHYGLIENIDNIFLEIRKFQKKL